VPLSRNLGTLTSWNPLGHSWPVTGLLYLYLTTTTTTTITSTTLLLQPTLLLLLLLCYNHYYYSTTTTNTTTTTTINNHNNNIDIVPLCFINCVFITSLLQTQLYRSYILVLFITTTCFGCSLQPSPGRKLVYKNN
jgi:hypothetical protein